MLHQDKCCCLELGAGWRKQAVVFTVSRGASRADATDSKAEGNVSTRPAAVCVRLDGESGCDKVNRVPRAWSSGRSSDGATEMSDASPPPQRQPAPIRAALSLTLQLG